MKKISLAIMVISMLFSAKLSYAEYYDNAINSLLEERLRLEQQLKDIGEEDKKKKEFLKQSIKENLKREQELLRGSCPIPPCE